jgi:hypothetical protein
MLTDQAPADSPPVPNFSKPPPSRIPAYKLGCNEYEYQVGATRVRGELWVDEQDVEAVLAAFIKQGVALPIYREHDESQGSFGALTLDRSVDGGIDQIWTLSPAGIELVASGRWMFDSPELVAETMPDGRKHLREIRSGSLVNKPARTGSRPLLMSTMANDYLMSARKALECFGALEPCVKSMASSTHEGLRKVHETMGPIMGTCAAYLQSAIEELDEDHDGMSTETQDKPLTPNTTGADSMKMGAQVLEMSAADKASIGLAAEVLKMTGTSTPAEALGKLEGTKAAVDAMKAELVKMGAELGIPGMTGDADKFKAYEPGRLLSYMSAAPRIRQATATDESPAAAKQHQDVEDDVDRMMARTLANNGINYKSVS